jgi:seryl-tRNA synthetase
MLDRKFILENTSLVIENTQLRNSSVDVTRFVNLETERRKLQHQVEEVRREANKIAKSQNISLEEKQTIGQALRDRERELLAQLSPLKEEVNSILLKIPNLTHPETPIGGEDASRVIAYGKTPIRSFEFIPRDHLAICARTGAIDMDAGAKVAGAGFYFLKGDAVLLELALLQFAFEQAVKDGWEPVITPDVARDRIMIGTGFVPRGEETNTYRIESEDLNLIATAEIPLCGLFADAIIDEINLPIKLCGISHCFRTERAAGRATRGLYRVHQFTKVELVALCHPDNSEHIHNQILEVERRIFDTLEVPYRVVDIASRDLGTAAYRKFDIEAWMPGRGDDGEYGEVTSTSNCNDYQARRLNIRYRDKLSSKTQYVHILNGTALALGRAMISIIENHQNADGSVGVPSALLPFIKKTVLFETVVPGL